MSAAKKAKPVKHATRASKKGAQAIRVGRDGQAGDSGSFKDDGGDASVPTLDSNQLRFLGEKADGYRDETVLLVTDGRTIDVVREADVHNRQVLAKLQTETRGPGVAGDARARIRWKGRTYGGKDLDGADALFVSQSAIQKFLLPYYMRFNSGAEVQALENKLFNDRRVAAAFHIPPSITFQFPRIGLIKPNENSDDFTCDLV